MKLTITARSPRPGIRFLFVAGCTLCLLTPSAAQAHFLWLTSDTDGRKRSVHVFLSETPTPDGPEFLPRIATAKITTGERVLSWTKGEDTYDVALPVPAPKAIDGFCDLGVMHRKNARFRLIYTARVQFLPAAADEVEARDHLRLRLVARPGQPSVVEVMFRGKPASEAVVKAFPETGDPVELKARADGRLEYRAVAERQAGLLAKWSEKTPGVLGGKPYDEVRYYATLTVVRAGATDPSLKKADTRSRPPAPFALLPEAVNSFGGAVLADWLYVYSGHTAKTHRYHSGATTKHFRRLNLRDRTSWEELPTGPALQGVTLVAHESMLYRIGGMSAKNGPGEPDDLVSVASFARFDLRESAWTELAPLPAPRSTHDAVVVGDHLYVLGGWSMKGGAAANAEFCEDGLVFDLSRQDARWERLPAPPFRRRALAVAAAEGKVYVLGGLDDDGKVVRRVDIYNPACRAWSRGPDLPGARLQGFGPSAFGMAGRIYMSGKDGIVYRLGADGAGWAAVTKLAEPRITHRLLPGIDNDLLIVGGNSAGAPTPLIESIPLDGTALDGRAGRDL